MKTNKLLPSFRLIKFYSSLTVLLFVSVVNSMVTCQPNDSTRADLFRFCSEKKGFNLLGKFDVSWSNEGYNEKEFSMIHDLGFNFVRLPIDYRTYTQTGNWNNFLEQEVQEIDKAVQWGISYKIHVCINLHRAPGYCVNSGTLPANQELNLWTDSVAQNAFVEHWQYFANRYKDISPIDLSFNLVNEPSGVTEEAYIAVMKKALQGIHAISPDRIVFIDGLDYGSNLIPALKDEPNVAQSIHCYEPFGITHYKAEWVEGSENWLPPRWPMLWVSNYLYGPWKPEFKSPLVIEGEFAQGTRVHVNVKQVSMESTLVIKAGTVTILTKKFLCGPDTGNDFSQVVNTQWGYQNISNKDFTVTIAAPATRLSFENSSGDWMTLNSISFETDTSSHTYFLSDDTWGKLQSNYKLENGTLKTSSGGDLLPFDTYRKNVNLSKEFNIPFMVQEFGVYNKTPHDVTLGFLADLHHFFNDNRIGWALWNFSGSFGILNSDRGDCIYEPFQGYNLDREMLDVLSTGNTTQSILQKSDHPIKFYPLPAKNSLKFSSPDLQGKIFIEISDISGRLVKSFALEGKNDNPVSMDISGLPKGIYILVANNKRMRYSGSFVVLE
jgi:aryl-phospho-beta-D-glucosidase BglC (GH1 family)